MLALLCSGPLKHVYFNSFQMSLIRSPAFLIPEVIDLGTQLSFANGKRLKVYPEINKLKGTQDWHSLQLRSFTMIYLDIRHSVSSITFCYY